MRFAIRLLALTGALFAASAQAGVIDWNFTYKGNGIVTTGTLVTSSTLDSKGAYDILSIIGTRTDSTNGTKGITGLVPSGTWNDNLLFNSGNGVDQLGIGFKTSKGSYDFYYNSLASCGKLGYREDSAGAYPYCSYNAPAITSFTLTRVTVPEPATLVLITLGLALLAAGRLLSPRRVRA